MRLRTSYQNAQALERIGARRERNRRLERERRVLEYRIVRCDVGWVAEQQIVALADERLVPGPLTELHARERERSGIDPRDSERRCRHVGGGHLPAWTLTRERERNGAGARAEIGHPPAGQRAQRECALDEQLRLRTWHQYCRGDREAQRPEIPPARQIGEGLTCSAALDERAITGERCLVDSELGVGDQPRTRAAENVSEQNSRVEIGTGACSRVSGTRGLEAPYRVSQHGSNIHDVVHVITNMRWAAAEL